MTVRQAADLCGFQIIMGDGDLDRELSGIYCCDLLSLAMGRAPSGCAWITVMSNVNAAAVASLTDSACVILAEGMAYDPLTIQKAQQQDVLLLATELPVFEAALLLHQKMTQES